MRIAQVSPLYESVPPKFYGGTERVVSYLTEELVRMGHEVTLFASGDSKTSARLVPMCDRALRLSGCIDPFARHLAMIERLWQMADAFDIIHAHIDYLVFSAARRMPTPVVTTLHGRLDLPDLVPVFDEFREMPVISISNAQRAPLPGANWLRTVYHGLPNGLHWPGEGTGGYLAFVGRICQEKRVDTAIRLAIRVGMPLKIAAKVDDVDVKYFRTEIEPLLSHPLVEFIGEIDEERKRSFLGDAYAMIFPIEWPEPFGLAMIEAMACGTPVIARRYGSVPEIVDHGVTGFIFETEEEAVESIEKAGRLDRREIRDTFERRFFVSRMAGEYLEAYAAVLAEREHRRAQMAA
jgi:glycosyltransferase involved in cell wall biosynthesis